jgi:transposase
VARPVPGHPGSTSSSNADVGERCFNRLKQYRAIATRYDKTALSYQAMIGLATLNMWL